jgi:hypothetical protein
MRYNPRTSTEIEQTNGILQGDLLNQLLFNIAAIEEIQRDDRKTEIYACTKGLGDRLHFMSCKNLSTLSTIGRRELFANKCRKPRNNGLAGYGRV